jgi:hypothetical protein
MIPKSGTALPDEIAKASETNAAIVTPTVAPMRADALDRFKAHFTIVILIAQHVPEMIARSEAVSILIG